MSAGLLSSAFPSPGKREDEGEGPFTARYFGRDSGFCGLGYAIAFVVALLMFAASTPSALAQNPTAAPTPMVMPMIPQIQLQTVPAYGPAPLSVGFFVASLNPDAAPIASYIWNFGDGQVSMLPPTALFHTYTKPGSYVVNVTVTDTDGHQASSFAGVIVAQPVR